MTRGEIWKDFFKKTVLTVLIAGVLFYWATLVFTKDGATNYFYVWLCHAQIASEKRHGVRAFSRLLRNAGASFPHPLGGLPAGDPLAAVRAVFDAV